MDILADYLYWRGDLSFRERPFTIFDQMVCSAIAYFDIGDVYDPHKRQTLGKMLDLQQEKEGTQSTALDHRNTEKEFLKAIMGSKRFRNAVVTDYEDYYSSEDDVQFAAITLRLDDGCVVVAFRGTDGTLAGWREDFMITFTRPKAQELALQYLIRNLKWNTKVYVCGHSKGGNLAFYAACSLNDKQLERVKAVYINDGPGLCEDVISKEQMHRIDGITTVIMPEDSVFGRIFEPPFTNKLIVKSVNSGVMAHSIYSWRIEKNDFVLAKGFSKSSDMVNNTLNKMLEAQDLETRKATVDKFFGLMKESGYERLSDFRDNGFRDLLSMIAKFLGTELQDFRPREAIRNQVENFVSKISRKN